MKPFITTDNNGGIVVEDIDVLNDLTLIANRSIDSLRDERGHGLWIFPPKGDRYDDKIQDEYILSLFDRVVTTGNLMGFVSCGNTQLTIRSRFTSESGNDWFMQYMLQKVFAINIFDLQHTTSHDNSLDIAALMLPFFLQKALRQGVYREYTRQDFNDSHLRGAIAISRHIRQNYPFRNGKVSYTTREFRYDNPITQLIRHTIEYILSQKREIASAVLFTSPETRACVEQIIDATPSYRRNDLSRIIAANLKPRIHPFFSDYAPLQRLCLQILRGERVSYGTSKERIHGILFDGAWLWEEYLNITFHKAGFLHPENRTGKGRLHIFKNRTGYSRYPDFIKDNVIADAKYKVLLRESHDLLRDNLSRDDLNQMITYLHITSSSKGIFVNPLSIRVVDPGTGNYFPDFAFSTCVGELNGGGGNIYIIGVVIPQTCESYADFANHMTIAEGNLYKDICRICDAE